MKNGVGFHSICLEADVVEQPSLYWTWQGLGFNHSTQPTGR